MQRRLRLRQQRDFLYLRHSGKTKRHPAIIISYGVNGLADNRYGFITPKHLGNAVKRNRIRRQMREVVRLMHPQLKTGYDVVFIARTAVVGQPFPNIQRIINELCERAGLVQRTDKL